MNGIRAIYKRELKASFASPVAYALITIFLALAGYFLYSGVALYTIASVELSRTAQYAGPQELSMADQLIRPYVGNLGVLVLFLLPLLTMRLFSEEWKNGSMELLLTWPLRDSHLAFGKFLGAITLYGVMIVAAFPGLFFLAYYGSPDWGVALTGFVGLFALGAAFIALGLFISALTENQVISGALSFGALLLFWIVGWGVRETPGAFNETIRYLSILEHLDPFTKGVIDSRDLVYFLSFITLFLFLSFRALEANRWRGEGGRYRGAEGNALLYTFLIVLALVLLNLFSVRHYHVADFTRSGDYTLSDQSQKVLAGLDGDVTLYAFVRENETEAVKDLLEQYRSDHFSYRIVDPDREPVVAQKYAVTRYGTYVVETAVGRRETANQLTEKAITSALVKAFKTDARTIYMLEGHAERSFDDTGSLGWSGAMAELRASSYNVKKLNWFTTGAIPDDADLLLLVGPRTDFQKAEIATLEKWLDGGGAALVTLDPGSVPNLQKLFRDYGVTFYLDTILDPVGQQLGLGAAVATVAGYATHPIVENFKAATFFPVARSLRFYADNAKKTTVQAIGKSAAESWGENDLASIEKGSPTYSEGDDLAGPRTLFGVVEWPIHSVTDATRLDTAPIKKGRLVAVGDSDFGSNAALNLSLNKDLLLNMVNWLLQDEEAISIRPRPVGFDPMLLTSTELTVLFGTTVVVFPLLVAFLGLLVYRKRGRE